LFGLLAASQHDPTEAGVKINISSYANHFASLISVVGFFGRGALKTCRLGEEDAVALENVDRGPVVTAENARRIELR
jgi:hypothetical protein